MKRLIYYNPELNELKLYEKNISIIPSELTSLIYNADTNNWEYIIKTPWQYIGEL